MEKNEDAPIFAIWDCGSPLYDSYELASLSHLIERRLMKLPSFGGSKRLTTTTTFSRQCDVITHPACAIAESTRECGVKESPSVMSSLGEFLGSKLWKRQKFGQRKDKPKKLRTGISCFCNK